MENDDNGSPTVATNVVNSEHCGVTTLNLVVRVPKLWLLLVFSALQKFNDGCGRPKSVENRKECKLRLIRVH